MRVTRSVALLAAGATLALSACGGDEENTGGAQTTEPPADIVAAIPGRPLFSEDQAPGTYVGATGRDGRHSVALVVQHDVAVVYVCDGEKLADWFAGPVEGGKFDLRSDAGTRIRGTAVREGVVGSIQMDEGEEVAYAAVPPSKRRPRTGLFVFDDPDAPGYTARWIVTDHGVRGLSSQASGPVTHGLTIRRASSGGGIDPRFAGVGSDIQKLQSDVRALQSELAASRAEATELDQLIRRQQQALAGRIKGSTTTTTTTTSPPPPTATPPATASPPSTKTR